MVNLLFQRKKKRVKVYYIPFGGVRQVLTSPVLFVAPFAGHQIRSFGFDTITTQKKKKTI